MIEWLLRAERIRPVAALGFSLFPPMAAQAATPCSAEATILRALAAHGAPLAVSLTFRGTSVQPDQSLHTHAPYAPHPYAFSLTIDEPTGAVKYHFEQAIAGDFNFRDRAAFRDGRGYQLDYLGRHEALTEMPSLPSAMLPQLMLKAIAAAATCESRADGSVHVGNYAGSSRDLLFDRRGRLVEVRRAPVGGIFGPLTRVSLYANYRQVRGSWVPGRMELRSTDPVHGTVHSILRLVSTGAPRFTGVDFRPPAASRPAPPRDSTYVAIEQAPGVVLLRNIGIAGRFSYNTLLIEQSDRVLLFDAPHDEDTSDKVRAEARRRFPDKPLTLILTHPHGDHIQGLRSYLEQGATLIGPRGTRALIARLGVSASSITEAGDALDLADVRNPVQLADFPSPHSNHLLVAFLPRQRLVVQADMINQGEYPAHAQTRQFLRWLGDRGWAFDTIVGIHGAPIHKGDPLL